MNGEKKANVQNRTTGNSSSLTRVLCYFWVKDKNQAKYGLGWQREEIAIIIFSFLTRKLVYVVRKAQSHRNNFFHPEHNGNHILQLNVHPFFFSSFSLEFFRFCPPQFHIHVVIFHKKKIPNLGKTLVEQIFVCWL